MSERNKIEDISRQVRDRVEYEQKKHAPLQKEVKIPDIPKPKGFAQRYLLDCARARDKGNGLLFAELMRGKMVFVPEGKYWLQWQGHLWAEIYDQQAEAAVEKVAEEFAKAKAREEEAQRSAVAEEDMEAAKRHKKNASTLGAAVWNLHCPAGIQACLKMSLANETPLLVPAEQLDVDPYILGCGNGLLDLRTGESRPGRPEDYVTRSCHAEWKGIDAQAPLWEQTVLEVFGDRPEVAAYFHKLVGYAFFGRVTEKIFVILLGEEGDSGKTTLMEILYSIMGDYIAPMPVELLLDQGRPESPNAPTPAIMTLKGLRLTWASEPGENRKFSVERIKLMSGNDSLTGRYGYDKRMQAFEPSHTLFVLTNHKLRAPASDTPFWNRVRLLDCPYSFVPNPKPGTNQRQRRDNLKQDIVDHEASGVLAWIARGYMAYVAEGLEPPEAVCKATAAYKREEDLAAEFIEECLEPDEKGMIFANDLYELFKLWYQANYGKKIPSISTFGRLAGQHITRTKNGRKMYLGYEIKATIRNKYKGEMKWEEN